MQARARDLGLSNYTVLFDSLDAVAPPSDDDSDSDADTSPTSPDQIPLSKNGCLLLVTYSIFSSVLFDTASPLPSLKLFPNLANLVTMFIGVDGPTTIGSENEGTIDSILAIGLWLEHSDKFVSGPLDDKDYLQALQAFSLISANTPSPSLRYCAHLLTSRVLHAHPDDRVRLTFITDTLEHCPYENLKASAVSWLKEEIIIARQRGSSDVFSSATAIASVQPFLYPDFRALDQAELKDTWEELQSTFPYIMAVVNFTIFMAGDIYEDVVPPNSYNVCEEIFAGPLRRACTKGKVALQDNTWLSGLDEEESRRSICDLELLEERLVTMQERYTGHG